MAETYRLPRFNWQPAGYFRKPWRLRWWLAPLQLYYGAAFRKYRRFIARSLYWSSEQIEDYHWRELKKLIAHASLTVPFYQRYFKENNLSLNDFQSLADLELLPIINREHLRNNQKAFISSEFKKYRGTPSRTSGTTGNVLHFYRSEYVEAMRKAVYWRHLNQIGYHFKQRQVDISEPFVKADANLLYRFDPMENVVRLNGRLLNMTTGREIHRLITEFQPILLHTPPSAAITIASIIKKLELPPLHIPITYTVSEALEAHARKRIHEYLSPSIFDHYGNRENSVSASQFPCGNYHINSEFVYLELVEDKQKVIGESYQRVIGTCLYNLAMPLIRYDSNDLARSVSICDNPDCRIGHPTIDFIGGREKNFLVTREGLVHCQFDDFIVFKKYDFIEEYQIVQLDYDTLLLKLVPATKFDRARDEAKLRELVAETTGDIFNLKIEYVDFIPRTKGFKKPRVVSKLASSDLYSD